MRRFPAIAGALVLTTAALNAGKTPSDIPINLWLASDGQALTSDGIQAFANGVYADYIDGLQNVSAVIQGGGNFRFSTQSSTRQVVQRTVDVNFGSQAANAEIPFFPSGASEDRVNILQAMLGYPIGATTAAVASLHPTQSTQKLVRWGWQADGYYYRLGYGAISTATACPIRRRLSLRASNRPTIFRPPAPSGRWRPLLRRGITPRPVTTWPTERRCTGGRRFSRVGTKAARS